jgi:hypothetical protein
MAPPDVMATIPAMDSFKRTNRGLMRMSFKYNNPNRH